MDEWIATNGKEPDDWEDYEYIWIYSERNGAELIEAFGCITWSDFSHWMPADIITPHSPVKGG